ncbi:MAG TPA: malectin domain-containing carbohydrate-binding protein [Pirellulaceae bacterium]|nr:malectin domain-containing carbohydrate-binding protein [Pirellulaceae bacterium]
MSGRFDPYHKWLGITPHERPANYYRLLGLDLFEDDLDAIECAADRLMKYVRDFATVEQRQVAREVLDELSAAKRCLLIAEQKRAYDAGLRAGRSTTRQARPAEPPPPRVPLALPVLPRPRLTTRQAGQADPAAVQVVPLTPQPRTPIHRPSKPKHKPLPTRAFASAGVVLGVVVLSFAFLRSDAHRAKQVAATSEVLESSDVLKQEDAAASTPTEPPNAITSHESREPNSEASVSAVPEPVPESSLPDFAAQTPDLDPTSDLEPPNPDTTPSRIKTELRPVVASDSVVEAPSVAKVARPWGHAPVVVSDSVVEAPAVSDDATAAPPTIEPADDFEITQSDERGGLLRELWTNVTGSKVEAFINYISEQPKPSQTETIDRFETPEDFGDQYGQRIRGYLHPPTTGNYEFSIRANAEGWLFISADALPENKQRVEPGDKVALKAGKAYYVEAFHKESTGRDYLTIGWKLPDGTEEKPIPGERLSVHYRIAPRHETEFVVLTPLSAESSSETTFDLIDDGKVLATGRPSGKETYQLTFKSEMETITALRLEAIPHAELPASGPGRGIGGRFVLEEVSVTIVNSEAPDSIRPVNIASAVDDTGHDLRRIVDGNEKTSWRVSGRGKPAAVMLMVHDPTSIANGFAIQVTLKQQEGLGCLRVLATSALNPLSVLREPGGTNQDEDLYSLYVNLGGDAFTTPDGVRWQASKLFDNETFGHEGGRGVSEDLIANKLQGSAQRGITAFRAMVPEGTYDVTLYFCEYWSTTPSSRKFAIAAEQRVVAANFDLFQAAGGFAKPFAYPIRKVTVNDGRLDLHFQETSVDASTILNAVSIQQVR